MKVDSSVRTSFDILIDLLAKDIDDVLFERARRKTPTERLIWLEEMQEFAEAAKKARENETPRAPQDVG